jgi:hypothetical protein
VAENVTDRTTHLAIRGATEAETALAFLLLEKENRKSLQKIREAVDLGRFEFCEDERKPLPLELLVAADEVPPLGTRRQERGPAVLIAGTAFDEAQSTEAVDVLARRRGADAEKPRDFSNLVVAVQADELEQMELRDREGAGGHLGQVSAFEDLADR